MKICKTETHNISDEVISVYVRLTKEDGTQKAINRFKNHLKEHMGIHKELPRGVIGQTVDTPTHDMSSIGGDGALVTIIKSKNYVHIVSTISKTKKQELWKAMQFFDAFDATQKTT